MREGCPHGLWEGLALICRPGRLIRAFGVGACRCLLEQVRLLSAVSSVVVQQLRAVDGMFFGRVAPNPVLARLVECVCENRVPSEWHSLLPAQKHIGYEGIQMRGNCSSGEGRGQVAGAARTCRFGLRLEQGLDDLVGGPGWTASRCGARRNPGTQDAIHEYVLISCRHAQGPKDGRAAAGLISLGCGRCAGLGLMPKPELMLTGLCVRAGRELGEEALFHAEVTAR